MVRRPLTPIQSLQRKPAQPAEALRLNLPVITACIALCSRVPGKPEPHVLNRNWGLRLLGLWAEHSMWLPYPPPTSILICHHRLKESRDQVSQYTGRFPTQTVELQFLFAPVLD